MAIILGAVLLLLIAVMFYRMERHMSANQEKLNNIANGVNAAAAHARKAFDEITAEIANLKEAVAAGETLDFTALEEAAANVGSAALDLDDIVPDADEAAEEGPVTGGDEGENTEAPSDPAIPSDEDTVTDPIDEGQRPSE